MPAIDPTLAAAAQDRSKEIVQFRGVSLSWLAGFASRVLSGEISPHLRLIEALEDLDVDVPAGRTVRSDGMVPYRAEGKGKHVSLGARAVRAKQRRDWTIADLNDFILLPEVMERQEFYVNTMPQHAVGELFQGAFVSQARQSRLGDLVSALEKHFEGKEKENCFVWLDIFSVNQPKTSPGAHPDEDVMAMRVDLIMYGIRNSIELFEERLFFFDDCLDPAPLKRMWCIWEVYAAITCGKQVQVIFAPKERDRLMDAVKQDSTRTIATAISKMAPKEASCFDPDDRKMICDSVEASIGWLGLKMHVSEQVVKFYLDTCDRALHDQELKCLQTPEDKKEKLELGGLMNHIAVLYLREGDLRRALHLLERSANILISEYGSEMHSFIALVFFNTGMVFKEQGKLDESMAMYARSIKICVATSETGMPLVKCLNGIGNLCILRGRPELGLVLFRKSMDHFRALDVADNEIHATLLQNLGMAYEMQNQFDQALSNYEESVQVRVRLFGTEEEIGIAETMNNMASIYDKKKDFPKALQVYQKCLALSKAVHGTEHHVKVANVLHNMSITLEKLGRREDALHHARKALEVFRTVLPPGHQNIRLAKHMVFKLENPYTRGEVILYVFLGPLLAIPVLLLAAVIRFYAIVRHFYYGRRLEMKITHLFLSQNLSHILEQTD